MCAHTCAQVCACVCACMCVHTPLSELESTARAWVAFGRCMGLQEELPVSWGSWAGGQHKEAIAVGGFSKSQVYPRVRCHNGLKGNKV